jgi:Protein of unknown function (DUF4019)
VHPRTLANACLVAVLVSPALAADKPEDAAQTAAESWLKLVDDGKYAESWEQAAKLFKGAVEQAFEKKASAVETVTSMLDPDGAWRVSGYFIR